MRLLLLVLLVLVLLPSVIALELCQEPIPTNSECLIVTPSISCSNLSYKVLNNSGGIINSGNLTLFHDSLYSFNFSQDRGRYVLELCDGGTREINVGSQGDEINMIALSLITIVIGCFFLFMGWQNEVWGAKLLGYGVGFLQFTLLLGMVYANFAGIDFTTLLFTNFLIVLLLGFGLGIYTFTMTTVSLISIKRDPGDWGVKWRK